MRSLPGRLLALCTALALVAGCGRDNAEFVAADRGGSGSLPLTPIVTPIEGQLVLAQEGQIFRVDSTGDNLAALTAGFQDADPALHPAGTAVAFSRLVDGQHEIFLIDLDGSGAESLTSGFALDAFTPNYSYDGTRIAFSAAGPQGGRAIYVMNADGSNVRPLTEGSDQDTRPAFSSNGQFVVFERASGSHSKISKVPVAGGEVVDLTAGDHLDLTPAYCPPDDTIVFSRDGRLILMEDDHSPNDDSTLTVVSTAPGVNALFPEQSPDGHTFYFLDSPLGLSSQDSGDDSEGNIYRVDEDGTDLERLTNSLRANALAGKVVDKIREQSANQVTVQVVNDSGLADNDVYIMLTTPVGQPADSGSPARQTVTAPPPLRLYTSIGASTTNATASPLGAQPPTGKKVKSVFTGQDRNIYEFSIQNLRSGQVGFSYRTPITITNGAAPTSRESYRYDKMEITYDASIRGGGGNLTSIDFFGIPLQVEVYHEGEGEADVLQTKTFFASTPTLLKSLAGLGSSMTDGTGWSKSLGTGTPGTNGTFNPTSTDFANFARILSPNTIAAADTPQARPAPYPSIEPYLASLVGQSFVLKGSQNGGYNYTCAVQNDGGGGFNIVCEGTTTVAPAPPNPDLGIPAVGPNARVIVHLPKGQAGPASNPAISMDYFTYACVANQHSYSVVDNQGGYPFTGATQADINNKVGYVNSTAYGSIVGDVQAHLNFGYINSNWVPQGGNADALFGTPVVLPYPYPYGGARATNDGFYNPYAALIYYLSDAYGHPFSDRLDAASPLYSLAAGDTIRITILPDQRLDAPLSNVTAQTSSSITLSWPRVSGATGYRIEVSPEQVEEIVISDPDGGSGLITRTISGLSAGTPYLFYVVATGTAGGQPIASNSVAVQGSTSGERTPPAQGPILVEANVAIPDATANKPDLQAYVNGTAVGATANSILNPSFGLNLVDLKIKQISTGQVVYHGNYFLQFVAANPASTLFSLGNPFTLQYNTQPLSIAPVSSTYPLTGNGMVIGTPFTPKPFYKFFQTVFPAP